MNIEIDTLEKILITVLHNVKKKGIKDIILESDFYWSISDTEIYDPYKEPTSLTIGQLTEDYQILIDSLKNDNLTAHNLKNISSILRYISDKFPY